MPLYLESCIDDSAHETVNVFVTCFLYPEMSEGEIASYQILDDAGKLTIHNFIGLQSGEFHYRSSDGIENDYLLVHIENSDTSCLQPALVPSRQELLLIVGMWVSGLATENTTKETNLDQAVDVESTGEITSCAHTDIEVSVIAGNFQTQMCDYKNTQEKLLYSKNFINSGVRPFYGLIKFTNNIENNVFTAELIDWNGL